MPNLRPSTIQKRSSVVLTPIVRKNKKMANETDNVQERLEREREALQVERERLAKERQELETMKKESVANFNNFKQQVVNEFKSLQQIIENQKIEINVIKQNQTINHGTGNNRDLAAVIENICMMNVDVKIPKFDDTEMINPKKFLNELERYFLLKKIPENCKLTLIRHVLENRAKMWFETKKFNNYDAFVTEFEKEFYSIPIQIEIKNKWAERKYTHSNLSLQSFYLKQINEAIDFTPKMEKYEINYIVFKQFPLYVQQALVGVDMKEESKIIQALNRLDMIAQEKEKIEKRSNSYNSRNFTQNSNRENKNGQNGEARTQHHTNINAQENRRHGIQDRPSHVVQRIHDNRNKPYYIKRIINVDNQNQTEIRDDNGCTLPDMSIPPPMFLTNERGENSTNLN